MGNGGLLILDREKENGAIRSQMRSHMRGNVGDSHSETYRDGYRRGYKEGWEDHKKELEGSEEDFRRSRNGNGQFV